MLTTDEALQAIRQNLHPVGTEQVALNHAVKRILRQNVIAERDQPPFDRVMMDGIAIDFAAFASGCRRFRIAATQAAGDPVEALRKPEDCIEIMTGAVLPKGASCIVPVERISVAEGFAEIEAGYNAAERQFIHPQASDHERGTLVLEGGSQIHSMDVAILASCGLEQVTVAAQPSIRVISTGNELVSAGRPIEDHQVRLSNGPALCAMLAEHGFTACSHEHLPDEVTLLQKRLAQHLDEADVLVLSGGVSKGKADFVPDVLASLGVKRIFHRVSQRPGKPMWFGTGPQGQLVFALPGNPVSALVCCRHYVIQALREASGMPYVSGKRSVVLAKDVSFSPDLTYFLPVRLESCALHGLEAIPVPTNTSGDFTSLKGTDGYIELAAEKNVFAKGSLVPLICW